MESNQQGGQKVGDPSDRTSKVDPSHPAGSGRSAIGDREYAELEQRFSSKPITIAHKEILNPIFFAAKDLGTMVIEKLPSSRERALALTHLQEFTWAVEKGLVGGSTF
ncbi:MAG: hypothetical protein M3P26_04470 [Gemmatimonadota bacterium]|nr:hypothetical protein [Gemmatimonadota bacterium]